MPLSVADIGASQDVMPDAHIPVFPGPLLKKRSRDEGEASSDPIKAGKDRKKRSAPRRVKRRTGANGVLEAAESTSRAHKKPATETPASINDKSEAARRGAGMLAAPTAHEVYHQYLPGPSVQEALVGTTAQGQLPWVEGREENATLDVAGNAVGQQDVVNTAADEEGGDAVEEGFRIPAGLTERTQLLLMATPEERARGVVPRPRCVICPGARFSTWDIFIRHCGQSEAHPVSVEHCRFCADFFARGEARERHEKMPPANCTIISPAEAEVKRRVTKQVLEGFERDLIAHLRFGTPLGEPFVRRMMRFFPKSAKRGSRGQNRLKT